MLTIEPHQPSDRLTSADGSSNFYPNQQRLVEAVRALSWQQKRDFIRSLGPVLAHPVRIWVSTTPGAGFDKIVLQVGATCVLADDTGQTLTGDDLQALLDTSHGTCRWTRRQNLIKRAAGQRGVPVPYTGRRHWAYPFRHPRTQQERRTLRGQDDVDVWGGENLLAHFPVERMGRRRWIPTAWDDICRASAGHSWKRHRRYQWKD